MLRSFILIVLSLIVFEIINSDIIEMKNETLKSVENNIMANNVSISFPDNHTNGIANDSAIQEDINTSDINRDIHLSLNKVVENQLNSSVFLDSQVVENISQSVNGTETLSPPQHSDAQKDPTSNTDEIPTFVEYQQMIEKETKQKREKSDSIPSSPTIIQKENLAIKETADASSSHQSGDHVKASALTSSSSTKTTELKDDIDAAHNSRKNDDTKVEYTTSILSKSLMKNNVAAKECGAKILELSSQITHANFVLNNNKDEYLNVPCSIAEKWFVFETCEPVQIRSIQIANFEMFSSRPKTFKVSTADRYPVKHWYNLGVFRALDEKGIQTFEVTDTRMVKYLKFEMIDHYGSEHYCPLTFVRVMGNVVIDDMDEEHDEDQPAIGENIVSPKEVVSTTDSDGILTKAKDMIVKIVNGIGGSQNKDNTIDSTEQERPGARNEFINTIESPCYFFEFVTKNYRNYFHDVSHHFLRILQLEKYLLNSTIDDLQSVIISQPFPLQIRSEYFALFGFVNKTEYPFYRLYQSFLNVSVYCSGDCLSHSSLKNISQLFKCQFYHYTLPGRYLPILPNVSTHSTTNQDVPSNDSASTVIIPDVVTKQVEVVNNSAVPLPGQYEPALSGNIDIATSTTSNYPTIHNDTGFDDVNQHSNKTKTELDSSENRTVSTGKDAEPSATENHKSMQHKVKTDEVFDNKMFANPGSNAWNYAFMRIKNIAKELEVNVSISMKYLEELSQNYKQQTDKLKKAQVLMAANVTQLENMINQHRQETRTLIKDVKIQLQAILIRIKLGHTSDVIRKQTRTSLNLSDMDKITDSDCMDILDADLILPSLSFFDSTVFIIVLNITISLFCNSILLAVFYNKMRTNILRDVTKIMIAANNKEPRNEIVGPIEDLSSSFEKRHSLGDLRFRKTFPVVMPPRGVKISNFPDCEYISDDDNLPRKHKGLPPYLYPVSPNVNFVTPSKDKKKKSKRK